MAVSNKNSRRNRLKSKGKSVKKFKKPRFSLTMSPVCDIIKNNKSTADNIG